MKTKLIFLLPLLWILIGCDDSDSATLNISESKFDNISASGESLTIDITCSSSWTVTSNKQWCIPSTQKEKRWKVNPDYQRQLGIQSQNRNCYYYKSQG